MQCFSSCGHHLDKIFLTRNFGSIVIFFLGLVDIFIFTVAGKDDLARKRYNKTFLFLIVLIEVQSGKTMHCSCATFQKKTCHNGQ